MAASHGVLHLAHSSPRAMETQRKRDNAKPVVHSADALRTLLASSITRHESVEVSLLHIMKRYYFSTSLLQRVLNKDHIDASFSNVTYEEIAPLVGLQPNLDMDDIENFGLHRSRVPTPLFKLIVDDMDVMLVEYGPLIAHQTQEARSRFLSPIFNRLIAVFGFTFRNLPESTFKGRLTTKGRVEYYFRTLGSIAVLCIEVKLKTGNGKERLDAIAQVIAKCNACDWNNTRQGFRVPVYGVLCDGEGFEFFLFDGNTKPFSFKRGLGPNDPPTRSRLFQLPDPENTSTTRPFIDALRPICEIIFDLLLSGYVSSLKAYHCSVNKSAREGRPRQSVDKWEEAISAAVRASQAFRDAETKRQTQLTDEADSIVEGEMASLKRSVGAIPILQKPKLIMSDWDDEEIKKV